MNDPFDESGELSTGDPDVDAALGRLRDLDELPVDEHGDVYEDVHGRLGAVLDGSADGADSASPAD